MRILHGSDFHGLEKAFSDFASILARPEYDLGVLTGDLTTYVEDKDKTERQLKQILLDSNKYILFIMGNDDGILDNDWASQSKLININLRNLRYQGINFFGYCYTNPYVGGPFEKSEADQAKDIAKIRKKLNENTVLLTHGPGLGIQDEIPEGIHVGSQSLRALIDDDRVIMHLCGHIHQNSGHSHKTVNMAYPRTREFADIDLQSKQVVYISSK